MIELMVRSSVTTGIAAETAVSTTRLISVRTIDSCGKRVVGVATPTPPWRDFDVPAAVRLR